MATVADATVAALFAVATSVFEAVTVAVPTFDPTLSLDLTLSLYLDGLSSSCNDSKSLEHFNDYNLAAMSYNKKYS